MARGSEPHSRPCASPWLYLCVVNSQGSFNYQLRLSGLVASNSINSQHIQSFQRGGSEGTTIFINAGMDTDEEGDFWFAFYLGDRLLNKLPIRIRHGTLSARLRLKKDWVPPQSQSPLASD